MNNEQLRAAFEAWRRKHYDYADLCAFEIEFAFDAFQAGRAAMQSQKPEPDVTGLVEARGETMRFALSEMVKWYENISLGYNPAFQYYDLAKKSLLSAALQSQDRKDTARLDWIESIHGCEIIEFVDGTWEVDIDDWSYGIGKSMREAIDHARRVNENKT